MKKILIILFFLPFPSLAQDTYKILGWSKDGKVAYMTSYSDADDNWGDSEEPPETKISVFIHDLRADRILDYEYIGNEYISPLKDYGIIYDTSNKFYEIEFDYGDNYATILDSFELSKYIDVSYNVFNLDNCWPELEGPSYTYNTHLFISNNLDNVKFLGSLQSNECWSPYFVVGYYISPFENQILLVLSSGINAEGMDDTYRYEFIGCSLNPSTFK